MRRRQPGPPPPGRCLPLLLLLALPGAAEPSFTVSVWPKVSVVEHGGSLWLNCSTSCRDPNATGGLETSLTKAREEAGPGWKATELVNIREWVSAPRCYFSCYTSPAATQRADITTYRAPEQVVLEPLPELELGQAYNLTCRVLSVAPVRHLTVTLRRGGQALHAETFQTHSTSEPESITVTHELIPRRGDHGQNVTCHAALDLGPHGPLFRRSSPPQELSVYAFPAPPQLQTASDLEVGTKAPVHCGVAGVFPAGAARFDLSFGGERVNVTVTTSGDAATAQSEVVSQAPGRQELSCTVSVGPVSRSAGTSVLVYSFPPPVLEIDQPQLRVNSTVSVTCRSPATQPPGLLLQLRDSQQTLASGYQPQLQLTLTAREEDNGRQFTCEGSLPLGSHSIVKNTSAQLAVLYGPTMDDSSCARTQIWVEETEQTLACTAQGNPQPAVGCTKDGASYGVGVPQRVAREQAGTYHCHALNTQGSASREVIVQVEYKPSMDESRCPGAWTWVRGTQQTFSCGADGVPAPEVACVKDGVSYRRGQGPGTADPTGTYQCNATNPHGTAAKTVTVLLEYKPTMDESSCPSTQTWLEGTLRTLACEADGIPAPRVPCSKDGAVQEFGGERNVSRNDAGTYWCTASNRHGSARRAVAVRVEYRPVILLLAVSPSAAVPAGASFSVSCSAEGSPAPAYHWTVPPAPNVNYSAENSTVTVAGAGRHNSGVYACLATNAHGRHRGQVRIQVAGHSLLLVLVTGIVLAAVLLLAAGLVYYLKATACKHGEYNVQDAENSSKATCLSRETPGAGDIYGIQLTQS